jgi:HSP20 family protein
LPCGRSIEESGEVRVKILNNLVDHKICDKKMSITPDDWFDRFFGNFPFGKRGRRSYFDDMFGGFDQMRKEMEREFEESFKDLETKAPKDLIREHETPEGGKVREIGPFVYGYSMTIGPDGKPRVKEFGNVKSPLSGSRGFMKSPMISSEREPLSDVSITDKEVKVVIEMPGVPKDKIKLSAYQDKLEITSQDPERKYHQIVEIPPQADIETIRSSYNNGILEIVFKKKDDRGSKGKEIKIE